MQNADEHMQRSRIIGRPVLCQASFAAARRRAALLGTPGDGARAATMQADAHDDAAARACDDSSDPERDAGAKWTPECRGVCRERGYPGWRAQCGNAPLPTACLMCSVPLPANGCAALCHRCWLLEREHIERSKWAKLAARSWLQGHAPDKVTVERLIQQPTSLAA